MVCNGPWLFQVGFSPAPHLIIKRASPCHFNDSYCEIKAHFKAAWYLNIDFIIMRLWTLCHPCDIISSNKTLKIPSHTLQIHCPQTDCQMPASKQRVANWWTEEMTLKSKLPPGSWISKMSRSHPNGALNFIETGVLCDNTFRSFVGAVASAAPEGGKLFISTRWFLSVWNGHTTCTPTNYTALLITWIFPLLLSTIASYIKMPSSWLAMLNTILYLTSVFIWLWQTREKATGLRSAPIVAGLISEVVKFL